MLFTIIPPEVKYTPGITAEKKNPIFSLLGGLELITSNTDNSDLEYENKKQAGTIRAYQLALGRNLALLDTELTRLKSIANVNNDGAQILAHMAGGAMSAANGIASAVFGEVA